MEKKTDVMFETAYQKWLVTHRDKAVGERKRRLTQGLGHAEKSFLSLVWWPAFGHFDRLIPEFEVKDFKDGCRYVDFVYLSGSVMAAIEIDGYGPHWRNIDRWQFADHLMRQNHLIIDGWKILRFSYDEIVEKPRRIQQLIQQAFGKWTFMDMNRKPHLTPTELGILQWADHQNHPISPMQAAKALGINRKTAAKHLRSLADKGCLIPFSVSSKRVMRYNPAEKVNIVP